MKAEERYFGLLDERSRITKKMKKLAWEIAPADIKNLLCGEDGLFPKNIDSAQSWLIENKRPLDNESPIFLIINGENKRVIELIENLFCCNFL